MAAPASGPGGPPISYDPPPNELSYYEGLFVAADIAKTGSISGRDCVAFLSRSKLPVDILKNIWNMSDNPKSNNLDRKKFFVAIRLIQLSQNGLSAQGPNLNCDPTAILRPPFFDGITGVSLQPFASTPTAPSPPRGDGGNVEYQHQQQQHQHQQPPQMQMSPPRPQPAPGQPPNTASNPNMALTQDSYLMLPGEQVRYESLFPQYEKDGFVYGKEAVELFTKSGLGKEVLRDIWNLVDDPVDNRLSKLEFAIAMHLIVCISKKNLPMPPGIPPSLKALKDKQSGGLGVGGLGDGGVPHQQQQQQSQPNQMNGIGMASGLTMSPGVEPQRLQQMGGGGHPPPIPSMHQRSFSSGGAAPGNTGAMGTVGGTSGTGLSMMNITDAFAGMQGDGVAPAPSPAVRDPGQGPPALKPAEPSVSQPNNPPLSSSSASPPQEELDKVQSVLQKLQAENISLKAQLGQCSEEEKHVRDEIARTVAEIGTLSQELTSLRSQVADAKSSLIEASSELKAQTEKRDMLRNLVGETIAMRDMLHAGVDAIQGAEASVREVRSRMGSFAAPPHPTAQQQQHVTNPFFDGQQSVNSGFGGGDTASYYGGVSVQGGVMSHAPAPTTAASQSYYQPPTVPGVPSSSADVTYGQQQQQPPSSSGPSEEALRNLETMKAEAESAQREATSADDHAKALGLQYEDLRNEARQAELAASEKQNSKAKRKGLLGGGKKAKKEMEAAVQLASEKSFEAQKMFDLLRGAEEKARQMNSTADRLRSQAEAYEIQLAEEVTSVNPNNPAPVAPAPAQVPMTQEQFGAMVNEQYMKSPQHVHPRTAGYAQNDGFGTSYGVANSSYTHPDPPAMGFGGYPSNPANATQPHESALMGGAPGSTLMGGVASAGNFADNSSSYGNASNGSILYTHGYNSDVPSKAANLMGGAPAAATDSSIVGEMSTNGSVSNYSVNYGGYTSDIGGQSLVSNKESNPNLAPDPSGHASTAGSQGMVSNKGSSPNLAPEHTMNGNAALQNTFSGEDNFNNMPTSNPIAQGGDDQGSTTGLSYGESMNTTGISYGEASNYNNNGDTSIARSYSNTGSISEYNGDVMLKSEPVSQTPQMPSYSYADGANQGTVEVQEADYSQMLGNVMSNENGGLGTISSNDAREDAFEGIPSPEKDGMASSQLPTNGLTESLLHDVPETQPKEDGGGKEMAAGNSLVQGSTQMEHTMNMMGHLNVSTDAFDGIPSPDKAADQSAQIDMMFSGEVKTTTPFTNGIPPPTKADEQNLKLQTGQMSSEQVNPSTSWNVGIPSPTASIDEYTNPFAQTS